MLVINPHRGIGPVTLGMSRQEVANAMAACGGGSPIARGKDTDCYFEAAFQVSFGNAGEANFIEVASSLACEVQFDGRDVFDVHADELLSLLRSHEEADPKLSNPPDEYVFPGLILTLWGRDEQYDHKGDGQRPIFAAVGVGAELPGRYQGEPVTENN